jgi:hypothetical protein
LAVESSSWVVPILDGYENVSQFEAS